MRVDDSNDDDDNVYEADSSDNNDFDDNDLHSF